MATAHKPPFRISGVGGEPSFTTCLGADIRVVSRSRRVSFACAKHQIFVRLHQQKIESNSRKYGRNVLMDLKRTIYIR